jgi:hypothetical protein
LHSSLDRLDWTRILIGRRSGSTHSSFRTLAAAADPLPAKLVRNDGGECFGIQMSNSRSPVIARLERGNPVCRDLSAQARRLWNLYGAWSRLMVVCAWSCGGRRCARGTSGRAGSLSGRSESAKPWQWVCPDLVTSPKAGRARVQKFACYGPPRQIGTTGNPRAARMYPDACLLIWLSAAPTRGRGNRRSPKVSPRFAAPRTRTDSRFFAKQQNRWYSSPPVAPKWIRS